MKTLSLLCSTFAFAAVVACGGPSDRTNRTDTLQHDHDRTIYTDTLTDTSMRLIDTTGVVPVP